MSYVREGASGLGLVIPKGDDPIFGIWSAVTPAEINAHPENADGSGWWIDNVSGQRLSHDEAAYRQQMVIARQIGATVDRASGWWLDDRDHHQLSHQEAWQRWAALSGDPFNPPAPGGGTGGSPFAPGGGYVPVAPAPAPVPVVPPVGTTPHAPLNPVPGSHIPSPQQPVPQEPAPSQPSHLLAGVSGTTGLLLVAGLGLAIYAARKGRR